MADIDAHAIVTIVPEGDDEAKAIAKTEQELEQAIAEDNQDLQAE